MRLNDLPLFPLELTILSSERAEAHFICVPPTAIINRSRRRAASHAQPIVAATHTQLLYLHLSPPHRSRKPYRNTLLPRINPRKPRAHYIGTYLHILTT